MSHPSQQTGASVTKNKKSKKRKKPAGAKPEDGSAANSVNGVAHADGDDAEDEEPGSPTEQDVGGTGQVKTEVKPNEVEPEISRSVPPTNGRPDSPIAEASNHTIDSPDDDTSERLQALATERDALRAEVTEMRKSLENIQSTHEEKLSSLQKELEETQSGKEHAETQYRDLLGRVNTIRTQLGERLKQNSAEIAEAQTQIEELEDQNKSLKEENSTLQSDITRLEQEKERTSGEAAELRSRSNISQQNWVQERDELIQREAQARDDFESARQAMQEWEVVALNERSLRENLGERVAELEEQSESMKEAYESVSSDRDSHVTRLDTLQKRVQEEHDARKKELREIVETSQAQLEDLRKQLQTAEESSTASTAKLEALQKELERALPFEKEVKEKNLLIGKLRHEAVILNDHLRKALRVLKKGKPEDNIDRHIVTNHFLQFLALDRSDPKKFQILQLIAALLQWTDEQRESAGLSRPGAHNASLRIAMSPFRRTPSTPSLNSELLMNESGEGKESLAELWSNFLEQEAGEGRSGGSQMGDGSRRGSVRSPGSEKPEGTGLGLS